MRIPLQLEVIAHVPSGLGFCSACELVLTDAGLAAQHTDTALDGYPPDMQDEFRRLGDWIEELADQYGQRIVIRVIDPQSPEGLIKCLRHRVRRYPTWLVDGRRRVVGWDRDALEAALGED